MVVLPLNTISVVAIKNLVEIFLSSTAKKKFLSSETFQTRFWAHPVNTAFISEEIKRPEREIDH